MPLLPILALLLSLFAGPALATGPLDTPRPSPVLGAPAATKDFLPVEQAFPAEVIETSEGPVLRFTNADGYYLYQHRFAFETEPKGHLEKPRLPPGEAKSDEYFGDVVVYYGELDIPLNTVGDAAQPYNLLVTFQGCADQGLCYPPETRRIPVNGGVAAAASPTPMASAPETATSWSYRSLALFFFAGLGLTFTPCVLPMLPILSGVVLKGATGNRRALVLSLAYALPMAACFALLGALMGVFGAELNLQARLQSIWVLVPFAAFFAAFALAMFGVYELRLPDTIRTRLDRAAGSTKGGSIGGAALLGVLSSLLVSPCVSAPLAGALLYISTSGDAIGGALQLFALGLGMGTPLVVFACGGRALLPRSGPWMVAVRNAFGVLLLAVSIWLLERVLPGALSLALWGTLAVGSALFLGALEFTAKATRARLAQLLGLALLVYGLSAWVGALQGESDPLRPLGQAVSSASTTSAPRWTTITEPAELEVALTEARQADKPMVLDWYADWCISCKVMEREVLNDPQVAAALGRFSLIRFDVTRSDAAQREVLDRYGLFGPPAIQIFNANGTEALAQRTVGETDVATLMARLTAVESLD
ncbi:protein-disulfide reductase DsbD [Pseudomonas matsuisoli]|uniref:Thiol:disulfide interchange protein DsbD n=1 Tax=Pseudomonas matsuisoli TaxID=1515666 RepID=A0A917UYS4_9PSED|nr:protein-disulfide reductase DsbD [Pseudomonas matsuisoli]GGJ97809.1 thiol:disulfide interchange protein DsbD [Pseudomonas matsuisoli]